MGQVNFLKGVQVIFGENRKLHNGSVMIQYALKLIRGMGITH